MKFEVGQFIEGFKGHLGISEFELSHDGATFFIFLKSPKDKTLRHFDPEQDFKIRFIVIQDVIMMLAKVGKMTWIEAPYNPHLSGNLPSSDENKSLHLDLVLVDFITGRVERTRSFDLSEKFTKHFFEAIEEQMVKDFDYTTYEDKVAEICNFNTAHDLARIARLNGNSQHDQCGFLSTKTLQKYKDRALRKRIDEYMRKHESLN